MCMNEEVLVALLRLPALVLLLAVSSTAAGAVGYGGYHRSRRRRDEQGSPLRQGTRAPLHSRQLSPAAPIQCRQPCW
jgi:hypothetical protein